MDEEDIPIIGEVLSISDDTVAGDLGPSTSALVFPPGIRLPLSFTIMNSTSPYATSLVDGDGEEEEEDSGPDWSNLPDIAVILIASFVHPWDRAKMGMTCHNWYRIVMSTPHLWRSTDMRFRGNYKDLDHVAYAKSVGRYLKKLYIYGGVRLGRRANRFQRTFTSMLQNLYRQGPVQLKELTVTELHFNHQFRGFNGNSARKGVVRSLGRFIRMQLHLERLDLSYACFTCNEGLDLLRAAVNKSKSKLKYLYIEDMFQREQNVGFCSEFATVLSRCTSLVDITLNYDCVSDDLLTKLAANCSKTLEYIHIRSHRCDSNQHAVDSSAWHGIRQAIPRLRVKFSLNGIMKIVDIQRLLVSTMPLQSVSIYGHNDDGFHPDRTVRHLARHYHDTLQKVIIDVGPVYRAYNRGLIALITDCTALRFVEVHGRVGWLTLREIFEHIDEAFIKKNLTPSLSTLKVVITSVPHEEPEDEMLIMEEYRPLFESHNLNYEVVLDPIYPPLLLDNNPNLMAVFW